MGQGLSILTILNWIDYFFPSLTIYTVTAGPIILVVFGLLSVFSDTLPEPGYKFPMPELEDLEVELINTKVHIRVLSRIARKMTGHMNWIISNSAYRVFYRTMKLGYKLIGYVRLSRPPKSIKPIPPPEPFISKSDTDFQNNDIN